MLTTCCDKVAKGSNTCSPETVSSVWHSPPGSGLVTATLELRSRRREPALCPQSAGSHSADCGSLFMMKNGAMRLQADCLNISIVQVKCRVQWLTGTSCNKIFVLHTGRYLSHCFICVGGALRNLSLVWSGKHPRWSSTYKTKNRCPSHWEPFSFYFWQADCWGNGNCSVHVWSCLDQWWLSSKQPLCYWKPHCGQR